MIVLLLLWALATVDSAFIGYREAAGRNGLIDKRAYYRHAMIRGALLGQLAVGIAAIVAIAILSLTPQPLTLFDNFEQVGLRMLTVYVPYAMIIMLTFGVRTVPSVDLRSITSVLIFGPFTLIRPVVVLVGAIWGLLAAPNLATASLVTLIVSLMLGMEHVLGGLRARGLIS